MKLKAAIIAATISAAGMANAALEEDVATYCNSISTMSITAVEVGFPRDVATELAIDSSKALPNGPETVSATLSMAYAGFSNGEINRFCVSHMQYFVDEFLK